MPDDEGSTKLTVKFPDDDVGVLFWLQDEGSEIGWLVAGTNTGRRYLVTVVDRNDAVRGSVDIVAYPTGDPKLITIRCGLRDWLYPWMLDRVASRCGQLSAESCQLVCARISSDEYGRPLSSSPSVGGESLKNDNEVYLRWMQEARSRHSLLHQLVWSALSDAEREIYLLEHRPNWCPDVTLVDAGPNRVQVIRSIREILPEMGIGDAKKILDAAPAVLAADCPNHVAARLRNALVTAGATLRLTGGRPVPDVGLVSATILKYVSSDKGPMRIEHCEITRGGVRFMLG